jgi:DNA-binding transcriptional LysR family regulator
LQFLRAVVDSGSVSAAAESLGYTASAISQQVGTLEREVGTPLLERAGRGVRPTAAGTLLAEHAAVIAKHLAKAETDLADLRAGRTGQLAIRYFATAGAALVPSAVARLRQEYPSLRVDLRLVDPDDPLPEVEDGRADVAIVVRPPKGSPTGAQLVHLVDDPFRVVLPKDHPLAAQETIALAELADEPWVGGEWPAGSCLDILVTACAAVGFQPRFVVESDDYSTAQGFVAAGMGVSVIPELGLGSPHPAVEIRPLRKPEPARSIYAAVRQTSLAQPPVRFIVEALREAATVRVPGSAVRAGGESLSAEAAAAG